ncbi:tripartite tricarboxylate transporter substrate binding protein [Mycobacterium sp. 21AC1]|uniref:tripartite tricarboxylate transporter substrate binding protein n=1 Tax=[Mycobacterium] appelbergii TaxID=2939269 RepID=UPI002938EA45|nr:tripartite tricarboxylate transporter substrate binding protein [Mycobacterium sp. 21AC1]MDV3127256.1 tripartite tricarboxylate transporter substrate binding protein [Mycobacterium sp. 21AC1]
MPHPRSATSRTVNNIRALAVIACLWLLATGCANSGSTATGADNFPEHGINVIVPFSAGGGTDMSMRALAEAAREPCGTSITITNVEGGAGAVGMQQVGSAGADGYTVGVATSSTYLAPNLGTSQLDPAQFRGVMQFDNDPPVISVPANSDIKTFDDLKKHAASGLNISTSGAGSITQLAFLGMAERAGVAAPTNVPLGGGSQAILAALGGQVDGVSATAGESYAQIKSGRLRAIAVMGDKRLEQLPDTPTLKELKVDWSIPVWRGLVVPAGVSDQVVEKLNSCFKKAFDAESFQSFMAGQSFTPTYKDHDDFTKFLQSQFVEYGHLVDQFGMTEK